MADHPAGTPNRFANFVARRAGWIVLVWVLAALLIRLPAPDWRKLALDGDYDYLPAEVESVAAERLLDKAFPTARPRSQAVVVIHREDAELTEADQLKALDLLRRLHHRLAEVYLVQARRLAADSPEEAVIAAAQRRRDGNSADGDGDAEADSVDRPESRYERMLQTARHSLDEAIRIDERYFSIHRRTPRRETIAEHEIRLTLAYWDRANLLQELGLSEAAGYDLQAALVLDPNIAATAPAIEERDVAPWRMVLDLVSWEDSVVGSRLRGPRLRLVILRSEAELAAVHNIDFLEAIHGLIDDVRARHRGIAEPGLDVLVTGSAAIGGETLIAARDAIRYTEWITVLMVLVILGFVYRSPLLVAIPLLSIGLAVVVSTGVISWLAFASREQWIPGFDLKVFTTSRIFVFVILFGAGTDYCLFLISRLREEAARLPWDRAVSAALGGVSEALLGSAMTTVVGLGMLWIARFGKFQHTGPVIAICLLIGLAVCMTLTPALLRLLGPAVFWPTAVKLPSSSVPALGRRPDVRPAGLWGLISLRLTVRPGTALLIGIGVLLIPGTYGWLREHDVTYDLSSQLSPNSESRRGLKILNRHLGAGDVNPTTVLVLRDRPLDPSRLTEEARTLSHSLYSLPGVRSVRSIDDPLGTFPPDRNMSLLSLEAWKRRALRNHPITRGYFFSEAPGFAGRLVRLDVVMDGDPFDERTARKVTAMGEWLDARAEEAGSPWYGARVLLAGTTPSIIDLRNVTLSDHRRIKLAVVVAVFTVLLLVIRRFVLSLYLIATVLLSYFATLGLTVLFFRALYGEDYVGLDWKLPLFLFVILVAVGQDYNVYLVTRVLQEQRKPGGRLAALRRAVARTGGIITACGVVMAATFFSMTSAAWMPVLKMWLGRQPEEAAALRGIVELGFALGLGVLLDTFYVRTILVPSFIVLLDRIRAAPQDGPP